MHLVAKGTLLEGSVFSCIRREAHTKYGKFSNSRLGNAIQSAVGEILWTRKIKPTFIYLFLLRLEQYVQYLVTVQYCIL